MKKNIWLFVALIASGNALRCYHCDSGEENGCKQESKPEVVKCGTPAVNYQTVCVYKAFYEPNGNQHEVISGCETIRSHKPIDLSSIHNCEDDKASIVDAPLLLRLFIPITYFVSKKLFF